MNIYCINPNCRQRENPDYRTECQNCNAPLTIKGYCLFEPLHTSLENLYRSGHIAEVWDLMPHEELYNWEAEASPKVLKILKRDDPIAIRLFQQEARVLSFLSEQQPRLGIPKVEADGYKEIEHRLGSIYCLLMEKVEGENLEQWLANNGAISEELAKEWLKELVEILAQIHKKDLIHRDIKPANIMLKDDNNKLVLIDFGAVAMQQPANTVVGTFFYMAPEQLNGEAVPRSDFYALGRTLVRLLTVRNLGDFEQEQLLGWRNNAPQISEPFANLIHRLIAPDPKDRPQTAAEILQELEKVEKAIKSPVWGAFWLWKKRFAQINAKWHGIPRLFLSSAAVAGTVILVRSLGIFQGLELAAYDTMIRISPDRGEDSRLLVITVDEEDLNYQKQMGMERQDSLSDVALSQLLGKLQPYQPRVIGLDIYRDFQVAPHGSQLTTQFKHPNFFAICKGDNPSTDERDGVSPPPEVPTEQIGFSDVVLDTDDVLRRNLWYMDSDDTCPTPLSFALQVALNYLAPEGIEPEITPQGYLRLGHALWKPLSSNTGGYHGLDTRGYQILLNYRSRNIAQKVSLRDALEGKFDLSVVKDKIVLIGTTAPSFKDNFSTPYTINGDETTKMEGVLIQGTDGQSGDRCCTGRTSVIGTMGLVE